MEDYPYTMNDFHREMDELIHIAGITLAEAGGVESINPAGFAEFIINKNCYCN